MGENRERKLVLDPSDMSNPEVGINLIFIYNEMSQKKRKNMKIFVKFTIFKKKKNIPVNLNYGFVSVQNAKYGNVVFNS